MSDARELPVVVAGGGPAGTAAALALRRGGRRVVLLEGAAGGFRVGESLPPAARPLLRDLGVLARVEAGGHLASFGNQSAWGAAGVAATDFVFDPNGPGWLLDRARFDASLRDAAREAGVDVRTARVAGVERAGGRWRVRLASGGEVDGAWLVDATGRRCALARRMGATRRMDDALLAFHARYRPASPAPGDADARTTVEAVRDGWWYTARIPGGERVVAFLTDGDLADRAALLTADGFRAALAEAGLVREIVEGRGYAMLGPPRGTEAAGAWLAPPFGAGWVAVGDAALSFDPLSSQGILSALYTGLRGGEAVAAALDGDRGAIAAYALRLAELRGAYLHHRAAAYAAEHRWPGAPFWARRHAALPEDALQLAG